MRRKNYMPIQNQEILFDKNRFTMAFLGLGMSRKSFIDNIEALKQYISTGKADNHHLIKDEKTVKEKSKAKYENQKDEDYAYIANLLYEFYKNQQKPQITEFFKYWDFIKPIFGIDIYKPSIQQLSLVLKKIDIFDEKTQLKLLRFIINKGRTNLDISTIKSIFIKIASNKNATATDRTCAAEVTKDKNICRDTIEFLKTELSNEMNKDFPDSHEISVICDYASAICRVLENNVFNNRPNGFYSNTDPEYQYLQMIRDEFDIDKILSAGYEYIPQIRQSLEERLITAEHHAKKAEDALNITNQTLRNEQQKNTLLVQQMDTMQQQINTQSSWIKTAKIRAATLKTGLFNGSDLKKYKDFMDSGPEY